MDTIRFKVNGVEHTVGCEVSSRTTLLHVLRNVLQLRGTKYNCLEGGCGSCIVTASMCPGAPSIAVNSCLIAITQCDNWEITTIEGLGSRKKSYHVLQTTLAEHHGTQCGYCSPGFVMTMHGMLEQKPKSTMLDIEKGLSSNLCRCTGYRSILEGFKTCGSDAPKEKRLMDIEDLYVCKKTGMNRIITNCDDDEWCIVEEADVKINKMKKIVLKDGKTFYKPTDLAELLNILKSECVGSCMLIGGNTAKGVYPIDNYPQTMADINLIPELKVCVVGQNLTVGAGHSLTQFMEILDTVSKEEYFSYLSKIREHVELVAHTPVRNVGTIAGNLMIKHKRNEFPSDIFLLLSVVGAQLTIVDVNNRRYVVSLKKFLKVDMRGKVILDILFPPLSDTEYELVTFKIMPRAQSAHAMVNAGFLYQLNKSTNTVQRCRIVYGNLSPNFTRARATEAYLVGKKLFTNETLQGALKVLDGELIVTPQPPEPSVEYRKYVAMGLFYKGLLSLCPSTLKVARYASGSISVHGSRQLSEGRQIFTTNPTLWPLTKPIQKVEAMIQTAGEAQYTEDIPSFHNEVFAAFVLSTKAVATIISQDASEALKDPCVIAYYTSKDIPGLNSYTPADNKPLYTSNEELLCGGIVKHYGQPVGIIVAETQDAADRASKLVKITYANEKIPVIDIKEARKDSSRNTLFLSVDATAPGTDVQKTITGSNTLYGQYHFTMETLVCVARPTEEGIEVHLATQWLDGAHTMISRATKLDQKDIDLFGHRLGGGYGMKISRIIAPAVGCSLVVQKLNRPCRFIPSLSTITQAFGKRFPCYNEFEVKVNSKGVIQTITSAMYEDNGYKINETLSALGADVYYNCYDRTKWNFKSYDTITDTPKNTWCRSPGTLETIACAENIMEKIAYVLSLDPVQVRLGNLDKTNSNEITDMVETLKKKCNFTARRAAVDSFNTQNRWKKRGLRFAFSTWKPIGAIILDVNMSVYHADGTICLVHSGVEMGQGINTKAIQMVAYWLKVPIEIIKIKGNNTIHSPNSFISGGSITTQSVCIGLKRCCDQLLERLAPIRSTLTNPTWLELVTTAYARDIDLQVHGFAGASDAQTYDVFGVGCAEVELDLLTGEHQVRQVDIMQDVGLSISPEIDIGQVEGAFLMGYGYWCTERLVYASTGELLTDRTWDYHLPQARDIPLAWNVYLKPNTYKNELILSSKATGEPGICISIMVAFALRECISKAREESGIPSTTWFNIDGPYTSESTCLAAKTKTSDFKFT